MNSGADSKKPRTCRSVFRESKAQWCHNCTLKKRADRCIRRVTWRANLNTATSGEQHASLPTKRARKPALRHPEFVNSQEICIDGDDVTPYWPPLHMGGTRRSRRRQTRSSRTAAEEYDAVMAAVDSQFLISQLEAQAVDKYNVETVSDRRPGGAGRDGETNNNRNYILYMHTHTYTVSLIGIFAARDF